MRLVDSNIVFVAGAFHRFCCFRMCWHKRAAYITVAIVYSLIALGLWKAKRWVFVLAILITLAQVVTVCSPSYVWDLAPGFKFGPYFTRLTYGAYCYVGAHFDFDYHQTDLRMSQIYTFVHERYILVLLSQFVRTNYLDRAFIGSVSPH